MHALSIEYLEKRVGGEQIISLKYTSIISSAKEEVCFVFLHVLNALYCAVYRILTYLVGNFIVLLLQFREYRLEFHLVRNQTFSKACLLGTIKNKTMYTLLHSQNY